MQKIAGFFLRLGKRVLGTLLLASSLYGVMNLLLGKTTPAYWWMAITPPLLWNCKKILAVVHKRRWTTVAFWGGCLWWQWQVTLLVLVPVLAMKYFIPVFCTWKSDFSHEAEGRDGLFKDNILEFSRWDDDFRKHNIDIINPHSGLPIEEDRLSR